MVGPQSEEVADELELYDGDVRVLGNDGNQGWILDSRRERFEVRDHGI